MEIEPEPVYGVSAEAERRRRATLARLMWGGFYVCPTNGRIIEALEGDDKAICRCGVSNPNVAQERTEQTGVHIVRFLTASSVEAYLDQQDREARA